MAVNIRFNSQNENPNGTADIFFPSFAGSQSMRNVTLSNLKHASADLHFEIPFGEERVVFDGRHKDRTISGDYDYNGAKGSFGLTRVANVTVESLDKYSYTGYQVASVDTRIYRIFVVSDLPSVENLALANQLFPSTLSFIQKLELRAG